MGFRRNKQHTSEQKKQHERDYPIDLSKDLSSNLQILKTSIGHSPDVVIRPFKLGNTDIDAAIVYIEGLADKRIINEHILSSLFREFPHSEQCEKLREEKVPNIVGRIKNRILSVGEVREVSTLDHCVLEVLSGNTQLLINGHKRILSLSTPGWDTRSLEEPQSEQVVRGPRVGFTETLRTNTTLMRRRIRDPNFSMNQYYIGRRSKTEIAITYIKGIVNQDLLDEVKRRIERIDIDQLEESGTVEQLIEDNYLTPFPQLQNTERPDRVSSALAAGRVAIFVDGTPFVLIVPATFSILMESSEDYSERWILASLLRIVRYIAAFFALSLPSLYVAVISYHQGLIPTKLAIFIAGTREGVPFPTIVEALLMEFTLEIIREAGVRLPKPVGPAVSIVGGLVIGEAAVNAGLVSTMMVVVVALTAISSFALPQYGLGIAIRILRFGLMFSAAVLGLYGVVLCYLTLAVHIVKLKSFGVNYAAPFVPYRINDWKDFIIRAPVMSMERRPAIFKTNDPVRQGKRRRKKAKEGKGK
ncbi:MAG TPA: spore germination protein [Bacillales bacterium]|nr:spore germination protein [Bacillales bacterium]